MAIEGGCLCGNLRYSVEAEAPVDSRMCWCRSCQFRASGNASLNIIFKSENLSWTGEIAWHEVIADSGNTVRRGFCPKCGTHIFGISSGAPDLTVVRVGSLDDTAIGAPASIIWTQSAPAWATLDPALPHYPKGPPAPPVK